MSTAGKVLIGWQGAVTTGNEGGEHAIIATE